MPSADSPARNDVPSASDLINPLLKALRDLGGSGSVQEIKEKVIQNESIPNSVADVPHDPDTSNRSELEYQLHWARSYLKKAGIIEASSEGLWIISPGSRDLEEVSPAEVMESPRKPQRNGQSEHLPATRSEGASEEDLQVSWRQDLHRVLTEQMSPDAFERLAKRLLRELGFVEISVTDRSKDGGIDGKGIMKLNGVLSFHIVFQCKRYKDSVPVREVRDFRGAADGKADRGLMITTGSYTREARKEATRDGATPIDLVDGDELADKLKELRLGVETRVVKRTVVDENWFSEI